MLDNTKTVPTNADFQRVQQLQQKRMQLAMDFSNRSVPKLSDLCLSDLLSNSPYFKASEEGVSEEMEDCATKEELTEAFYTGFRLAQAVSAADCTCIPDYGEEVVATLNRIRNGEEQNPDKAMKTLVAHFFIVFNNIVLSFFCIKPIEGIDIGWSTEEARAAVAFHLTNRFAAWLKGGDAEAIAVATEQDAANASCSDSKECKPQG